MPLGKFIPEFYPNLHPIFIECRNGNANAVHSFLESGLSVNIKDENYPSLISTAIAGGYLEIVAILIKHGLDVNLPINRFGETPLLRSLSEKQAEIARLLLDSGANPNLADQIGHSPIMSASAVGDIDMIELLISRGADQYQISDRGRNALLEAVANDQVVAINWWLANGANPEQKDANESTALIIAAKAGKAGSTQTLLAHGVDIHAKDKRGKTALDWAKANGHQKVAELLEVRINS